MNDAKLIASSKDFRINKRWELPGGPGVRIWHYLCYSLSSNPDQKTEIFAVQPETKE